MELLEIAKLPTAENSAIHLNPLDNVAIARIQPGEVIHRYGQTIGRAKQLIEPGKHVHTHNVSFEELTFHYEFPSGEIPYPAPPKDTAKFLGYKREDGRVGTRNYIAVVAATNCAA